MTNKQFSDRMMIMNSISILGFGIVYPIIGRAYQENLMLFWLAFQTFVTFGCGWLINKLLETPKIKQIVFKSVPIVFTIAIVLDIISIAIFIITHISFFLFNLIL